MMLEFDLTNFHFAFLLLLFVAMCLL